MRNYNLVNLKNSISSTIQDEDMVENIYDELIWQQSILDGISEEFVLDISDEILKDVFYMFIKDDKQLDQIIQKYKSFPDFD